MRERMSPVIFDHPDMNVMAGEVYVEEAAIFTSPVLDANGNPIVYQEYKPRLGFDLRPKQEREQEPYV